jgi:transcriptional regulator with XRE-family HTH domain
MPRPERPIDPNWPLADFAGGLRGLRKTRGITYREMVGITHYSLATLSAAANGRHLPTLEVTLAYACACDGGREEWERRWQLARDLFLDENGNCGG